MKSNKVKANHIMKLKLKYPKSLQLQNLPLSLLYHLYPIFPQLQNQKTVEINEKIISSSSSSDHDSEEQYNIYPPTPIPNLLNIT